MKGWILPLTLGLMALSAMGEAELRVIRSGWMPQTALWRTRLALDSGPWEMKLEARRLDGEVAALPHRSGWLARRWVGGWRLAVGDHRVQSATGAALGVRRSARPGAMDQLLSVGAGGASRSVPVERGISLCREMGEVQGGLLVARNRRDQRRDGQGFLLDLIHNEGNRSQVGAWQDELGLAWLNLEGPGSWELGAMAALRRDPESRRAMGGAQLLHRGVRLRHGVAWEWGEQRLLRAQFSLRRRQGWLQLDAWRGRQLTAQLLHTQSLLPLGQSQDAGGLHLQAGVPAGLGGLAMNLRWLEPAARSEDRAALRWELELNQPMDKLASGLACQLRHTAADARPVAARQDRWLLGLSGGGRNLQWRLAWESAGDSRGETRSCRLQIQREWRGSTSCVGVRLALGTSEGSGPVRLVPVSLGPGLLHHMALVGTRQQLGLGAWLEKGANQLALGVSLRESLLDGEDRQELLVEAQWAWKVRGSG